jgi:peptidoglycan hydrolase-like protein with peptidoglycan-binding domain
VIIPLSALPSDVEGIYDGEGRKGTFMPTRMRFLHPEAAKSFLEMDAAFRQKTGHALRCSDMLRSAEASLAAKTAKPPRGAAAPAYSGHNFGLSIDLDLDWVLHVSGWTKKQLDEFMADHGWYCYWRDSDKHPLEDWHYNYFGDDPARWLAECAHDRTTGGLEAKIQSLFGSQFVLTPHDAQADLRSLRMYSGALDGELGPISRAAIAAFQRAWNLFDDGQLNIKTQRTLAFLAASVAPIGLTA